MCLYLLQRWIQILIKKILDLRAVDGITQDRPKVYLSVFWPFIWYLTQLKFHFISLFLYIFFFALKCDIKIDRLPLKRIFLRCNIPLKTSCTFLNIQSLIPKYWNSVQRLEDINIYLTMFLSHAESILLKCLSTVSLVKLSYSKKFPLEFNNSSNNSLLSTLYEQSAIKLLLNMYTGIPCFGWQRICSNSLFLPW